MSGNINYINPTSGFVGVILNISIEEGNTKLKEFLEAQHLPVTFSDAPKAAKK